MLSSKVLSYVAIIATFIAYVEATQYCATINPAEAAGADGYVALNIADGVAKYSFNLDLNNYDLPTTGDYSSCSLATSGLKYHVHSYWLNSTYDSAANAYCGASISGGHFDPNLACSGSSQYASSLCMDLSRTSTAGYTYTCNTTLYNSGQNSYCEVGDIAGKSASNGVIQPNSATDLTFSLAEFVDYQPPYNYNYLKNDPNAIMWASFVFHCAVSGDPRLVCGKFSMTDLTACANAMAFTDDSYSGSDDSSPHTYTAGELTAGIIVPSVVLFFIGVAIGYFALAKKSFGGGGMHTQENPLH